MKLFAISRVILPLAAILAFPDAWGQTVGQRIVTLEGFGDYFVSAADGQPQLVRPDGLGVNIVAVVQRID